MPFYFAQNLVEKQTFAGNPWEFVITENITEQIRGDKEARQEWYRNATTKHCFYTGIEASNPNQRISKEDNPPRMIYNLHADYDIKIPAERITEAIATMQIKPSWHEISLGRKHRLIWTLPRPLPVESYDFCVFVLQQAKKWLCLEMLPGLDGGAFESPERLLCNGGVWEPTGHGPIPENELQAFFVECGRSFRFNSSATVDVPLDVVEKAIRAKWPNLDWPGEFLYGAQGPSFWLPASTSPMSAIVKKDGMFTFSNSADKPFYPWSDLLGPDFIKTFSTDAIANATKDIWWDEKNFWRKKDGVYVPLQKDELLNYFEVDCGMPSETTKGKKSMSKVALSHIYNHNYVANAAPYLFRPPGLLMYLGKRRLNTYRNNVVKPATELTAWGPHGKFPFHCILLDNIFDPHVQLAIWLAWHKYFYQHGLEQDPQPGCMCFLMGGVGIGKTLLNREIVGGSVGGFADASGFVIKEKEFNWHLYEVPLWCLDDETTNSDYPAAQARVQAILKKMVANKDFTCNQKFRNEGMTEWMGRIIATTNLDFSSTRIVGTGDNGSLDKISMFKCAKVSRIKFPERNELQRILKEEQPYFLRWLLEYNPPDYVIRDNRFGFASYQEPSLLEQAHQTSRIAPFKELLIEALLTYFNVTHQDAKEWRGTVTQLQRQISMNPLNESILRTLKLDQINRYLENVQREGVIPCVVEPGPMKTRLWVFKRFVPDDPSKPATPVVEPQIPNQNTVSIFTK